ncbi:MAG: aspartate dehydrogenase [Thiohalophilus sp.]
MALTTPMTDIPAPRIGVLGCGNIATIIAQHNLNIDIVAVYDRHPDRAEHLAGIWGARACKNLAQFIEHDMDFVLELASIGAVEDHAVEILQHGKKLILLSVGALANEILRARLINTAQEYRLSVRIPSGALFGLDNLKIGRLSPFDQLLLRTTKSPDSLGISTDSRQCLFNGSASECIEQYPKNVNVAVALGLAAACEARVELWVDPQITQNRHEILIQGEFGQSEIKISNLPCPDHPATSYLAALSVMALLEGLNDVLTIGT